MDIRNRMWCRISDLPTFEENRLLRADGSRWTLTAMSDDKTVEMLMYLDKVEDEYKVRVLKYNPENKTIRKDQLPQKPFYPHPEDGFISYEESSAYYTFFFEEFAVAKNFVANFTTNHPEFGEVPVDMI